MGKQFILGFKVFKTIFLYHKKQTMNRLISHQRCFNGFELFTHTKGPWPRQKNKDLTKTKKTSPRQKRPDHDHQPRQRLWQKKTSPRQKRPDQDHQPRQRLWQKNKLFCFTTFNLVEQYFLNFIHKTQQYPKSSFKTNNW